MALTSTDWLLSSGWRQGLFTHCIEDLTQPIPFNYEAKEEGCYPSRDVCKFNTFLFSALLDKQMFRFIGMHTVRSRVSI